MLELVASPERVRALGQAARQHALQHSWEAAADATEAHLHALTGG
jgi:hypothetical protein